MGWCYQVDIVAAYPLKVEHHVCQFFIADFVASPFMGYRPILAEHTAETAVGKKYGTRTTLPHKWQFFTKMRVMAVNYRFLWSTTEAFLPLTSIHATAVRAQLAFLQYAVCLLDPFGKFALQAQLEAL